MKILAREVSNYLDGQLVAGYPDQEIRCVLPLSEAGENEHALSWASAKNMDKIGELDRGVYIVPMTFSVPTTGNRTIIIVPNPRLAFMKVLKHYFEISGPVGVEPSAMISPDCKLGADVYIGHNVVIESSCKIGRCTRIGHNTVLLRGTEVGENVVIGSNCTIGGTGFGYEKDESGSFSLITHLGNVVIEDMVEIGNNTAIDRAVLGATHIRRNAKIDNLVHIAHGVEIGENALIIAHAMIAGSCRIGANCWIAPSAAVINKITIGANATVGIGAVVLKDVTSGDVVAGVPAKSLKGRTA